MKDFGGRFVFCCLGVWMADRWLSGIRIGNVHDRWPMKFALVLLVGLMMTAVSQLIKPVLNMLNLPSLMFTIMLIWALVGSIALWLLGQLAYALKLPIYITHFWWHGIIAALIIGWWASLMEPVNPPVKK